MTRASALPPGEIELAAGSSFSLIGSGETDFPAGSLDSMLRVGAFEQVELGAALRGAWTPAISVFGAALDVKIELLELGDFHLAVDPGLGWDVLSSGGERGYFFTAAIPILCGLDVGEGHQLIAAPAYVHQRVYSRGAGAIDQPFFGGSLGFAFAVDGIFTLLPSLALFHSAVGTDGSSGTTVVHVSLGGFLKI